MRDCCPEAGRRGEPGRDRGLNRTEDEQRGRLLSSIEYRDASSSWPRISPFTQNTNDLSLGNRKTENGSGVCGCRNKCRSNVLVAPFQGRVHRPQCSAF